MDAEEQSRALLGSMPDQPPVRIFPFIRALKKDVTRDIDTVLSWEQLTASDINFAIVRPLVFKYARTNNPANAYICLVVRAHFLSLAENDLAHSGMNRSRANLCEILAMKLISYFAHNKIQLVTVLTTGYNPLAGAAEDIVADVKTILGGNEDALDNPQSALEMAIATKAKRFISTSVVQSVVNDIYAGRVVSHTAGTRSLVADNYKSRGVSIYDVREAPVLDHYRLRVPRYGALLEFMNFALLFTTYMLCLTHQDLDKLHTYEVVFMVFAVAFALDEYTASIENGWHIYIANMWNVFDTSFVCITLVYVILRARGLATGDTHVSQWGFDILATGACILLPRLAFFIVSNNMVIMALRAMGAEFIFFMCIAAICFSGVMLTLWTLGGDTWSVRSILWLMIQIWFGNTYLSFSQAASFHPVLGPVIMTIFAALSNTLLLTILISILSNTFSKIDANANDEYLYQYTISTMEGMKNDALISYQPPFNLLALAILWPSSFFLSARKLHTLNVFLIRTCSFPILCTIHIYERFMLTHSSLWESTQSAVHSVFNSLPRAIKSLPGLDAMLRPDSNSIYEAIFDIELGLSDSGDDIDRNLFGSDADDDRGVGLHSWTSRQTAAGGEDTLPAIRTPHRPRDAEREQLSRERGRSVPGSPTGKREPKLSLNASQARFTRSSEAPSLGSRSPLARLFAVHTDNAPADGRSLDESVQKISRMLEEAKDLPVNSLKAEMKELQQRQARIENLLMTLTRGMRHEVSASTSGSHL